jgi:hypothetical protein
MDSYSSRVYISNYHLSEDNLGEILQVLHLHGAVRVINTGIEHFTELDKVRDSLGFNDSENFIKGGRTTKDKQPKWVTPYLRNMDFYPPHLELLANNEVQYQRHFPRYILFFCHKSERLGGRTFLHDAKKVEEHIRQQGALGSRLLTKLLEQPAVFKVGYLCQHSTLKKHNYFMSWQERFGTHQIDEALAHARTLDAEVDSAWLKEEQHPCAVHSANTCPTLMTQITLPNFVFDPITKQNYLRFPRMAMTPPEIINGYRSYEFIDGSTLSEEEQGLLKEVYRTTREGIQWNKGDFLLFDNIRYGHSREPFQGERTILVGMAKEYRLTNENIALPLTAEKKRSSIHPYPKTLKAKEPLNPPRYQMPTNKEQWRQQLSSRIFDAQGTIHRFIEDIKTQFSAHGYLHVINTGLLYSSPGEVPESLIEQLGFGENNQFYWGGLTSGRTMRGYLSKYMRTVDNYPNHLFLLPHNEILYQHFLPTNLLFFYANPGKSSCGGRTFVHSARTLKQILLSTPIGQNLLNKLETFGFLIESGFVDQDHPLRETNYFRSWQERFGSTDRERVFQLCKESIYQFDHCWWKDEPCDHKTYFTLMTQITVPAFKTHDASGEHYLLFPRIAYDAPAFHNGYRRFLLGNGTELSSMENDILLKAYWDTREAHYPQRGDILLIDNIRYGHSRESFIGVRSIGVTMADLTWSNKIQSVNEDLPAAPKSNV